MFRDKAINQKEIIFFDDNSSDDSEKVRRFKGKQTKF